MKKSDGISYRLAKLTIFFAISLGILFSLIAIGFDYKNETAKIDATARQILQVSAPSATEAAHQLDIDLATEVVAGLFSSPFIVSASITDDSGNRLAIVDRPKVGGALSWAIQNLGDLFPTHQIELWEETENYQVGHLAFTMSKEVALSEFFDRLMVHFLSGIAKSSVLSVILFAIVFYMVGQPLMSLRKAIGEVDSLELQPVEAIGKTHRNDEIGAVQNALNTLLKTSQNSLQDLKATQDELVENERRMSDFARAGSDWFWETDENDLLTYVSEGFFTTSGHDRDSYLENLKDGPILGEDQFFTKLDAMRRALSAKEPFRNLDLTVGKADGTTLPVVASGVPVFQSDGTFAGYRGICADRTDLQASESERARLTEELGHAQRLRAVGQLTGGIAHDFNNMLAVIMGCVELVQTEDVDEDEREEALAMALDATKRGAKLTHRLLAYSRQQPLSPKSLDSKNVLMSLEDLLRRSLGETIDLELFAQDDAWHCFADKQELETVILNLAINARDAMPDGGKLKIKAYNARLDENDALSGFDVTPGEYVCFCVSDAGTGMDEETVARAFDPYFTTKAVGQGSGLGLSMAFGFAKQSHGHISIDSALGSGTTVKVYLPKSASDRSDEDAGKGLTFDGNVLKRKRILLVEDNSSVSKAIQKHLALADCVTVAASDANDALEQSAKHHDFDIFLLDVVLPGAMTGPELAKALRDIHPDTPIVFMSGYTENSILHGGPLDDSVQLLQKPFSSAQLKAALIRSLTGREAQTQKNQN